MRVHCILNRDGGTLKTSDLDDVSRRIAARFEAEGHVISIDIVSGREVEAALGAAAKQGFDVVLAGGGDGTISAAAGKLKDGATALGILPCGTMNLFARSMNIPLDLDTAAEALARGAIDTIDTAMMNGRVFLLHFSVGLHAQLVKKRKTLSHNSRLQKIYASVHAALATLLSPTRMTMNIDLDGRRLRMTTPALAISNNVYGEGHLPYADRLDEGVLGVYLCKAQDRFELFKLGLAILLGRWQNMPTVDVLRAREASVEIDGTSRRHKLILDGEMLDMPKELNIAIAPKSLKVLRPAV